MPAKGKAGQEAKPKPTKKDGSDTTNDSMTAPPHLTGRWDFSRLFQVAADPDLVDDPEHSMARVQKVAHDAVEMAAKGQADADISDESGFVPKPMTHEEVRLWLQSFNAGPYALLKYKGDVPYKETQNYVPRVLKAYEEDHTTEYDQHINKYAAKYGLDPQLIKAIMKTESNFNNDTVSHAGARGLMQVMPVVWQDVKKKYGFEWDYSSGVFEPEKNIEVACAYLAWLRYDFLPRHFDAYDKDPDAPTILVRDKDRGVPDRESPRIVASAAASDNTLVNEGIVLAAAIPAEEPKVVSDAGAGEKSAKAEDDDKLIADASSKKKEVSAKAESKSAEHSKASSDKKEAAEKKETARPKVEISDAGPSVKKASNGKTRVVMRGGNGKGVKITVANGKVSTKSKSDSAGADVGKKKAASIAKAKSAKEEKESQGG